MKRWLWTISLTWVYATVIAENGYNLWLRYVPQAATAPNYKVSSMVLGVLADTSHPTQKVIYAELELAAKGWHNAQVSLAGRPQQPWQTFIGTFAQARTWGIEVGGADTVVGSEGYIIKSVVLNGTPRLLVLGNSQPGLLYGSYHLLRLLGNPATRLPISVRQRPATPLRMLNHWDNLTRYVERGYAGISIFNWHALPDYIDQRYIDYARANASIGINATVLTNVNANAQVLTPMYLQKVKALADVLRPYQIKVYLTARFSAPVEIGKLPTSDPLDPQVINWWQQKAKEIYTLIPDFGGFLVKANSEGQPGPQSHGRSHADGANVLARALKPFGGTVIWRVFVYSNETPEDRFKQPYQEFVPLDGQFEDNVILQAKNGPIDFQPREPFHPLFGAMQKTPVMLEVQLTQEYLGFATHLVYLAPMFKEVLDADTYRPQKASTVGKWIAGQVQGKATGIAGVANIGNEINWTGHPFAQANWYALGRLAWDVDLTSEQIAREWIQQTFGYDKQVVATLEHLMMHSHEAVVNYMTPLGLHHIMGYGHHYGPAPWFNRASRADWNCTYFHKADEQGVGFDRTATGSNALAQYAPEVQAQWQSMERTDAKWLTWFHHVPWNFVMANKNSFWNNLALHYQAGVDTVRSMQRQWAGLKPKMDAQRYEQVRQLLHIQQQEAVWWKDACLTYFQTFSKMPLPAGVEQPLHTLEYYKSLQFPYAPGNGQ